MRIALLRRAFDAMGGAELYLQRLLHVLSGRGHEIHLFTEEWAGLQPEVQLHTLSRAQSRADRVRGFDARAHAALTGESFDCVFSLERTRRQDVFRVGDGVHRVWLEQKRQYASWWRKPFVGWSAFHRAQLELESAALNPANTGRLIVNSQMVKQEVLQHHAFPEERIHLVRNGVEPQRWMAGDRQVARERFGVAPGQSMVLFAGSGWERKGLPYAIAAMRQLPQAHLLVAGRGRKLRGLPANVTLAGAVPDLEHAMAAADVFVLPTIYEPSANVCFEALAAGVPVVTSQFNGASEVIEPMVNGTVLSDPADTTALAGALRYWLEKNTTRPVPVKADLAMDRNVNETIDVLELAANSPTVNPQ